MLDFTCRSCGRTFSVPENRAGQRGKCPGCGNIMIVPARSESSFVFDRDELVCNDPQMQRLYDSILAHVGHRIIRHSIREDDILLFELYTQDGRSQLVFASSFYDKRLEKERLLIYSRIGTISEHISATVVLGVASRFPQISFSMDDNRLVSASLLTDLDESVDELWAEFLVVAAAADILESILFEWDVE